HTAARVSHDSPGRRWEKELPLRRLVVGLGDVGGDTAPRGHLVAIPTRPLANYGALFAADRNTALWRRGAVGGRLRAPPAAHPVRIGSPLLQPVTQLRGIFRRQIDLVRHAVDRKLDGLVCDGLTVDIVDQANGDLL